MDQILLCTNHIPRTTLIHNSFIENYMPEANGDYVKVYLYLAKCIQYQESELSISSLADRMDNTEKDVIRALQYWEKRNLMQLDRDPHTGMITGIHMLPEQPVMQPHEDATASNKQLEAKDSEISADHSNTADIQTVFTNAAATAYSDFHNNPADRQTEFTDGTSAHSNSHDNLADDQPSFANDTAATRPESCNNPADTQTLSTNSTMPAQLDFYSNPADASIVSAHHTALMQEDFSENVAMIHPETVTTSFVSAPMSSIPSTQPAPHTESKIVPIAGNNREISVSSTMLQELASNEEFVWTCHVIESYLDRPMKPNETRLVSYLYGTLHFSKDLLLYLYEYCISLEKTNNNYIQAVALSWNEQGVTTPEEAEKVSTAYNSAYNAVSKSLALGRALATVEKKCVDRWQQSWHMDLSVILEACNRTILKVHKADFKYIEGILDRWQKNGVHTLQDVEKADLEYAQNKENSNKPTKNQPQSKSRNQFQNFQQRKTSSQEVDDLERRLLMR